MSPRKNPKFSVAASRTKKPKTTFSRFIAPPGVMGVQTRDHARSRTGARVLNRVPQQHAPGVEGPGLGQDQVRPLLLLIEQRAPGTELDRVDDDPALVDQALPGQAGGQL